MSRFSARRISDDMSLCRLANHLCSMLMFRSSAAALAATAAEKARLEAGGVNGAGTVWCKLGGEVSLLAAADVGLDPNAEDGRDPWAVGAREDNADRAVNPPTVVEGVRGRSLESSSKPNNACFSLRSLNLAESLWLGIARTRAKGVLGLLFPVCWGCTLLGRGVCSSASGLKKAEPGRASPGAKMNSNFSCLGSGGGLFCLYHACTFSRSISRCSGTWACIAADRSTNSKL
mmetsp:Transcript_26757/g.59058  ORF Transcript_26757/g.59058 Transcript_26757/m.59058 type:complete len:232 (+) Transcript_26757:919-1614(+)